MTKATGTTKAPKTTVGPVVGEFKFVVVVDKTVSKGQGNAWEAQCRHFLANVSKMNDDQAKEAYKTLEKEEKGNGWTPSNVYMSNKSVILRAKRLEVSLLGEKGALKGKTQVQNECNDSETTEKSVFDKYQAALTNMSKYFDKLEEEQVPAAFHVLNEFHKKATVRVAAMMESRKAA